MGSGISGAVILIGLCFKSLKQFSLIKVMISDDIEFVLNPVSKIITLPVFLTDFTIDLVSKGLQQIKSMCSKSIFLSFNFL